MRQPIGGKGARKNGRSSVPRGNITLVEAQPRSYVVKGELPKLLAYKAWSVPAFADGKLYLRDERHLLCLDLRK
jgi:hypothetical protein